MFSIVGARTAALSEQSSSALPRRAKLAKTPNRQKSGLRRPPETFTPTSHIKPQTTTTSSPRLCPSRINIETVRPKSESCDLLRCAVNHAISSQPASRALAGACFFPTPSPSKAHSPVFPPAKGRLRDSFFGSAAFSGTKRCWTKLWNSAAWGIDFEACRHCNLSSRLQAGNVLDKG
jgi:hypothetical protein